LLLINIVELGGRDWVVDENRTTTLVYIPSTNSPLEETP
jgi:hypothetical protein